MADKTSNNAGLKSIYDANTAFLETMGEIGAEVMSFLAERVGEDVKVQHELLHCTNIDEARRIHARFVQKAIEQYQAETGKLVEMGVSAFRVANGTDPS